MAAPATVPLDIANMALVELGQEPITDLAATTSKSARMCNSQYANCRDEVLRQHPWNCASKRAVLAATTATISGATAASPVVITATAHGLSNGDFITISGVVGMTQLNGQRFKIADKTDNTFELQTPAGVDVDGSAYTAYTSGGTATLAPAWGFAYNYALPSDFIRLSYPEQLTAEYRLVGNRLYTDESEFNIEYVYRLETVSSMDHLLVTAIAMTLAARIAEALVGSKDKAMIAAGKAEAAIAKAKLEDSREGPPSDAFEGYTWINAGGYVPGVSEYAN